MRRLSLPLSLVLLTVLGLGLKAIAGEGPGADGLPVIAGSYAGKVNYTFFPLEPSEKKKKGSFPATCEVTQKGAEIQIVIDVQSEEGLQQWTLTGALGNSNFWVTNGSLTEPLTLSGHVKGKEPKLKLKLAGVLGGPDELNEVKFSFAKVQE